MNKNTFKIELNAIIIIWTTVLYFCELFPEIKMEQKGNV